MPSKIFKVRGQVQNYAWGGHSYIPQLLNTGNAKNIPHAEYWLGLHPSAPMTIDGGTPEQTAERLGTDKLPFLFKILDVAQMLSIQVHPTIAQAEVGFERENSRGIAQTAPNRNYKDKSDKPELMVALSEFWLLHGFATTATVAERLRRLDFLAPLLKTLNNQGLSAAFRQSLDMSDPNLAAMLQALKAHLSQQPPLADKHTAEFWIHRWVQTNPDALNGLLSVFFMNVVEVQPGEAVYQPPGLLHAYLEGQNVELMANSDNVLRAGLTPKHIDVAELLNIANVETTNPSEYVLTQELTESGERIFRSPFSGFELSELPPGCTHQWQSRSAELLFCLEGTATVTSPQDTLNLRQGEAVMVNNGADVRLDSHGRIFRTKGL